MSGSTAIIETISERALAKYVRFLIGSFRLAEADDGEVLTRGLTALFAGYPESIVRAVCDPRSGLPATSKFFPTLYEVRSACEARMRPILEHERRKRLAEANEADRPAKVSADEAERRRAFISGWRADMAIAAAERGSGESLAEMDARKCQGEMRDRVAAAGVARLKSLKADYLASPCELSDAACGTSPGRPVAPVIREGAA